MISMGLGLAVAACVEPPGATRIVGPDGTAMLHVHCPDEQVTCFQLAGERCPQGYDLSPIFDPHDGNFLVRCRDARVAASIEGGGLPEAAHARSTIREADRWPPSEVVATPTEPWPAASGQRASPAPGAASTVVDPGF